MIFTGPVDRVTPGNKDTHMRRGRKISRNLLGIIGKTGEKRARTWNKGWRAVMINNTLAHGKVVVKSDTSAGHRSVHPLLTPRESKTESCLIIYTHIISEVRTRGASSILL